MPTIFLDECGYTGSNLLDLEQPIFSLASLNCPEETCKEIKQSFFSKVQAQELKYTKLSKLPSQKKMLLNFFHELGKNRELVKFFVAHKKYVLVTKMVEILLEPFAYENDIDIYDQGENIRFSNFLYYALPVIGGRDFFEDLLIRFQKMINSRTLESYDCFFELVFEKTYPDSINGLLDIFRGIDIVIGSDILDTNDNLNIPLSCTFSLMSDWRKDISGNIILIHDASSQMAKNGDIWNALVKPNRLPVEFGYDHCKFSLPIGVKETCEKNSKDWAGLQLADLLAGGVTQYVKWFSEGENPDNEFCKKLAETQLFDCIRQSIWPDASTIDHFSQILMESQDK